MGRELGADAVVNVRSEDPVAAVSRITGGKGGGRGAFSGLRTSEIERLDWQDVKFDTGCVVVQKGKVRTKRGRARRIVPMMPNLKAWLKPLAKESGPVSSTSISPANGVASATAR